MHRHRRCRSGSGCCVWRESTIAASDINDPSQCNAHYSIRFDAIVIQYHTLMLTMNGIKVAIKNIVPLLKTPVPQIAITGSKTRTLNSGNSICVVAIFTIARCSQIFLLQDLAHKYKTLLLTLLLNFDWIGSISWVEGCGNWRTLG